MDSILVYADSLTWGIVPDTRRRLPFEARWPGVLERELARAGRSVRVIEDCLNGRRTAWEDPYKPGRNGLAGLPQAIEAHSPLALVILMLGTNDFQSLHAHDAWHSAQGISALVQAVRRAPIEPGMPVPEVLIVAPPAIRSPRGPIAPKFAGAEARCAGLAAAYARVAEEHGCAFFDAEQATRSSVVDGVHLDADQHAALGRALAEQVAGILALESVAFRTATLADVPALRGLIAESARALAASDYTERQIEAALASAWGVDTQLIHDGTYFAGESGGQLVACGGWSWRQTLFGGDAQAGRTPAALDPSRDAARVRAFFVHPLWSRRGLGRALLARCEEAARAAGFRAAELVATLPGERLYRAHGYVSQGARDYPLPDGQTITFVPMRKERL